MAQRAGWNPARRNRNIGTEASGHGRNNRMVVPERYIGPVFWNDIGEYTVERRTVHGREVSFVVERTHPGFVHACSVDDVAFLLGHLPAEDQEGLGLFVFRQPTKKQRILAGCWGRLIFHASLGRPQDGGCFNGPAILLEAGRGGGTRWRSASMRPEELAAIERLERHGHRISRPGGRIRIESDLPAIRSTQLFHTVLHEIGHWVDFNRLGDEAFFSSDTREREVFAHRYADTMRARLTEAGIIPFPPIASAT